MNRTVRGKEYCASSADLNDEEAFARHKAAHQILHLRVHLDTGRTGKEAVLLHIKLVRAI
ncbi:hypothetical protein D3C84_1035290 [compost metagenome]